MAGQITRLQTSHAPCFLSGPQRMTAILSQSVGARTCLRTPCRIQPRTSKRRSLSCQASAEDKLPFGLERLPEPVVEFTRSPLFRWGVQGAVVLVILAGIDAGYSGDWSRIGLFTHQQEDQVKGLLNLLAGFHVFCASLAQDIARRKGLPVLPAVLKVLAVGFLALVETVFAEPKQA